MVPNSLLQNLDPESAKSCGRNAIDNLLMRSEAQLIANAAVALGHAGLHGYKNPAAMAFYATALCFSTVLAERDHDISGVILKRSKWGWF